MNAVDLRFGALFWIAAAGIAAAAAVLLVFRKWSDQAALRRARDAAQAHLLEFRLFMDEPRAVLRAQADLLADNVRIFRLMLKPLAILTAPMILCMWQLDAFFGKAPLPPGSAAVVSIGQNADRVEAPPEVTVETEAVHIAAAGETAWRIRPRSAVAGRIAIGGFQQRLVAGSGIAYLPEPLLGRPAISIAYPRATVLGWHWAGWFLLISAIAAFVLRRPLGAVF